MQTSKVMDELREIRDKNSLRHLSQTPEEFSAEMEEAVAWFVRELADRGRGGEIGPDV